MKQEAKGIYPKKTGICYHCGGDEGIHKFETMNCPKNGMEESDYRKPQLWQESVFEDSGFKRFYDSAPQLAKALQNMIVGLVGIMPTNVQTDNPIHMTAYHALHNAKQVLKEAGLTDK